MSESHNKRKDGPGRQNGSAPKKRQGGDGGRWQTPKYKEKLAERMTLGTTFAVGDEGFWVTYQKGMKTKTFRELRALCDEYGERLYGIDLPSEDKEEDTEDDDIEASIQREIENMRPRKPTSRQVFTLVNPGIECVVFVKTMKPVDPVEMVIKICQDAKACTDIMKRKTRYVNRLTPISNATKATGAGIDELARNVLAPWFKLRDGVAEGEQGPNEASIKGQRPEGAPLYTYAIRHSIRNHQTFDRDSLINKVAGIISTDHKVQLKKPDKIILVEVFQAFCGMSVVDGSNYEEYKKFNVHEMYRSVTKPSSPENKDSFSESSTEANTGEKVVEEE